MSRDKQNEIHELAKQMSEAISTAVERRYIEDEAKLQVVLIENGWRKASDVAREIFEEIEAEIQVALKSNYEARRAFDFVDGLYQWVQGKIDALSGLEYFIAELKKKYAEENL